jgi:hypothetical protein
MAKRNPEERAALPLIMKRKDARAHNRMIQRFREGRWTGHVKLDMITRATKDKSGLINAGG